MDKKEPEFDLPPGAYETLVSEAEALLRAGGDPRRLVDKLLPMVAAALEEGRRARQRSAQADGIRRARASGVRLGRPTAPVPDNFPEIIRLYREKKLSASAAAQLCGMAGSTFFSRVKEYEASEQVPDHKAE